MGTLIRDDSSISSPNPLFNPPQVHFGRDNPLNANPLGKNEIWELLNRYDQMTMSSKKLVYEILPSAIRLYDTAPTRDNKLLLLNVLNRVTEEAQKNGRFWQDEHLLKNYVSLTGQARNRLGERQPSPEKIYEAKAALSKYADVLRQVNREIDAGKFDLRKLRDAKIELADYFAKNAHLWHRQEGSTGVQGDHLVDEYISLMKYSSSTEDRITTANQKLIRDLSSQVKSYDQFPTQDGKKKLNDLIAVANSRLKQDFSLLTVEQEKYLRRLIEQAKAAENKPYDGQTSAWKKSDNTAYVGISLHGITAQAYLEVQEKYNGRTKKWEPAAYRYKDISVTQNNATATLRDDKVIFHSGGVVPLMDRNGEPITNLAAAENELEKRMQGLAEKHKSYAAAINQPVVPPRTPIQPAGTYQANTTKLETNLLVGFTLNAADGVTWLLKNIGGKNPAVTRSLRILDDAIEKNPDLAKVLNFELDVSGQEAIVHINIKPQLFIKLPEDQKNILAQAMNSLGGPAAKLGNYALKFSGQVAKEVDLRASFRLDEVLQGKSPKWEFGFMWVGPASIQLPIKDKDDNPKKIGVFAYATVRRQSDPNLLGNEGRLKIYTGIGFVGPKLGNVSTIAFNSFTGNVYGSRGDNSAIGDVKYQLRNDKIVYGIEMQIQVHGGSKTFFVAYPEITSAVNQFTGGKLDDIPKSTAPSMSRDAFIKEQLKQLPPDMYKKFEQGIEAAKNAGTTFEVLDDASTVLAPIFGAWRGGILGFSFASWQSLSKLQQEAIDYLLSEHVQIWNPENAADAVWKTIRNGNDENLVDLLHNIRAAILQGKDTGLFNYSKVYADWKKIADEGYKGIDANEVYNSPYFDGPRPYTKAEFMEQLAKAYIYGTGGDIVRSRQLKLLI